MTSLNSDLYPCLFVRSFYFHGNLIINYLFHLHLPYIHNHQGAMIGSGMPIIIDMQCNAIIPWFNWITVIVDQPLWELLLHTHLKLLRFPENF